MPDKLDPKDPSNTSEAYDFMTPKWAMIETLLEGTQALREAGETYLPAHEAESDINYQNRLNAATLFNMTELTLNAWVGKPFSDHVELSDDTPPEIVELAKDIDMEANELTVFARNWFKEGLAKSFAHVLIDFPALNESELGLRSRADDLEENRRPYWQLIKPENIIFASARMENGKRILEHVRIFMQVTERVDFIEVVKSQILVLEPGTFAVWELRKVGNKRKLEWIMIDSGTTSLDFIPLVTFYADQQGFMLGKPPLEDLAYLNVRHWQSTSDQVNILTVARFPLLAVSGAHDTNGNIFKIGPRQLLATQNENGKFYFVEHTGKAIGAGQTDISELEQQMAAYGAEFLRKRPGNLTATARALDSAEATSPLQDATIRFNEALNLALKITAIWMDSTHSENAFGGTAKLPTDFGPEEVENADMLTLFSLRKGRDISRKNNLLELQRRGALREDFDFEENLRQLREEEEFLEENKPANIAGDEVGGERKPKREMTEETEDDD